MVNSLQSIKAMTIAFTKRYFRDKVALFFTFAFPLIFLLIFGTIFGGGGSPSFDVVLVNNSSSDFSNEFVDNLESSDIFTLDTGATYDEAAERLGRSEIDAI